MTGDEIRPAFRRLLAGLEDEPGAAYDDARGRFERRLRESWGQRAPVETTTMPRAELERLRRRASGEES
jgi:hypothetical protein